MDQGGYGMIEIAVFSLVVSTNQPTSQPHEWKICANVKLDHHLPKSEGVKTKNIEENHHLVER